jgi:hypothetical protein
VGVHHVKTIAPMRSAQFRGTAREGRGAAGKLVQRYVDLVDVAQRTHLVAHERTSLRMGLVGEHVGDHEGA